MGAGTRKTSVTRDSSAAHPATEAAGHAGASARSRGPGRGRRREGTPVRLGPGRHRGHQHRPGRHQRHGAQGQQQCRHRAQHRQAEGERVQPQGRVAALQREVDHRAHGEGQGGEPARPGHGPGEPVRGTLPVRRCVLQGCGGSRGPRPGVLYDVCPRGGRPGLTGLPLGARSPFRAKAVAVQPFQAQAVDQLDQFPDGAAGGGHAECLLADVGLLRLLVQQGHLLHRPVCHYRVHQVADGVAVRRAGCRAGAGSELHRVVVERPDGDWRRRLVGVAHARTGSGRWTGLVRADGVRLGGREVLVRLVRPVRDGLSGPRLRGIQPVVGGRRGRPTRAGVRGLGGGRVRRVRVRGNGPGCGPALLGGRRLRSRPGRRGGSRGRRARRPGGRPGGMRRRAVGTSPGTCRTGRRRAARSSAPPGACRWRRLSRRTAGRTRSARRVWQVSFERGDEEQVVILASVGRVRPLLRPVV